MSVSVASVTLAFNAAQVLPRQLEALLRQVRPLQEVIVVDNGSSDGTSEMLAEHYPQVTVLRMKENEGAAGAWARGLAYAALEKGHDWVWSFDDDSVPTTDALARLLGGIDSLDGAQAEVGIVAPMPVHPGTRKRYPPWFWRNGFVKPTDEQASQSVWFADMAIASGSLVRREVVREIGVPRADFFMDVFDFEYCLRIRSHGYKIAVITRAEMSHEIGNTRKINLLGYKRLWMNQPPWREYYMSRNLTYLAWWLLPNIAVKRSVIRHLVSHMGGVALFSSWKLACLTRMVQGFHDGLRGRLGIRLRPGADRLQSLGGALRPAEHIKAEKA